MSKKLFSKFFVFLLVVGLLFAVAPTGQALAQTVPYTPDVSIQNAADEIINSQAAISSTTLLNMSPVTAATTDTCNGTYEAYVNVVDVTDLAAYTLSLTYDADLITVTNVENVGFVGGTAEPLNTFADGNIKFGWSVMGGAGEPATITGNKSLIKITFTAKGLAGAAAFTLDPVNTLLVHWDDVLPIPFEVTGGAAFDFGSVVTNTTKSPTVSYCDLAVAVLQATSGDTLRADVDFTVPTGIAVQKALTLNTNGKTITYSNPNNAMLMVYGAGDLTVTGGGVLNASDATPLSLMSFSSLTMPKITLADATISGGFRSVSIQGAMYHNPYTTPSPVLFTMTGGTTTDGIYIHGLGAELIVSGGTVTCTGDVYACPAPIYGSPSQYSEGTKVTISDTANVISPANIGPAIYQPQDGQLFVTGGTISGLNAINMEAGNLTVSGTPTITGTGGDAILMNGNIEPYYPSDLTANISGGIITSTGGYALHETALATTRTSEIAISGGKFTGSAGAVQFTTVDPAILKLTAGAYNTDPGATPDYVFEPLDTYKNTTDNYYYIQEIIAGTIAAYDLPAVAETVAGDVVDFLGDIPWYPADPAVGRTQGNHVGVYITEPTGFDPSQATLTIGTQTWNWQDAKDNPADNFVPVWQLITTVPQTTLMTVQWNPVSTQVFTVNVQTGSVLLAPPEPIITSTDIQGYYLAGEAREFNVKLEMPADGANYALMIFDYKLAGVSTADITSFEFFAQDLNQWIVMGSRSYETYGNCTDGTGICGQFGWAPGGFGPIAAGFTNTSTFRVNFANAFTAPLTFTLDLSGKLLATDTVWTPLTTYTGSLNVYPKPVITSTELAGPFQQGQEATVTINLDNVGLMNDPNSFVLHLDLPAGTTVVYGDVTYTCTATGCDIPVTLAAGANAIDLAITFNAPFTGPLTVTLVDAIAAPDRDLATFTTPANVVVYGNVALVTGTVSMQGRLATAGVPFTLTGPVGFAFGPYTVPSVEGASGNVTFTDLAVGTYTLTTLQPRYLNITADLAKTINIATDTEITALWLRGGNAIWTDNLIDDLDLGKITSGYTAGITLHPDADVNFDNKINIQDLALVGGNFDLTSAAAYSGWQP